MIALLKRDNDAFCSFLYSFSLRNSKETFTNNSLPDQKDFIVNPFRGGGTIMYHLFCLRFFYISDRFWHFIYANIYLLGS